MQHSIKKFKNVLSHGLGVYVALAPVAAGVFATGTDAAGELVLVCTNGTSIL